MRPYDAWRKGVCFVCWGTGRYVCVELMPADRWAWPRDPARWATARCWRCQGTGRFPTWPAPDEDDRP